MAKLIFLIISLLFSSCVLAEENTQEFQLSNGLKLIVRVDHRSPLVFSSVWYRVGGSYEHDGITGVSHVLEHMMFKGTHRFAPDQLLKIVSDNGGQQNAMTLFDYTVYYQLFAASKLPVSFELESDRMRGLFLQEDLFKKELSVVMAERRMRVDDDPRQLTLERFYAAAFVNSPYHNPVIGWVPDIENLTLQNLNSWYQTWYAPNNAVVLVIGDVDPQQVFQLAQKYFGSLLPHKLPEIKPRMEIANLGERSITVSVPAKLPWIVMGYNAPTLPKVHDKWKAYALAVAASILGGGDSSRFSQTLVRGSQIATDASADYSLFQLYNSIFVMNATPAAGHSTQELKAVFLNQIQRLQNTLVSKDELERVKAQIIAQNTFQKDSPMEEAFTLGVPEMMGLSWKDGDALVSNIQAVTPEQVQAVAREFLVPQRLTTAMLQPSN